MTHVPHNMLYALSMTLWQCNMEHCYCPYQLPIKTIASGPKQGPEQRHANKIQQVFVKGTSITACVYT